MTERSKRFVFPALAAATLALSFNSASPSSAAAWAPEGKSVYTQHCALCHSGDGSGNTPVGKSLKLRALGSAEVQKQSDAKLSEIISKGKNKMPGFSSKLKAEEITELVAHIRTMAKK
jgi:mono/diheme cytochrome c family protein